MKRGFAAPEEEMRISLLKNALVLTMGSSFQDRIESCEGFYLRKKDLDTPPGRMLVNEQSFIICLKV